MKFEIIFWEGIELKKNFCMSFTYIDYGKTRETIKHANGI